MLIMQSASPPSSAEEAHRRNVACALEMVAELVQQRRKSCGASGDAAARGTPERARGDDLRLSAHAFCLDEDEPCADGDEGAHDAAPPTSDTRSAVSSLPASAVRGRGKDSVCEVSDEGGMDCGSLLSQASTVRSLPSLSPLLPRSLGARDEAVDPDFLPCLHAGEYPSFASPAQLFLPRHMRTGPSSAGSTPFGSPRMT